MNDRRDGRLTVLLRGGFANQLFQWASALWLREATGCEVLWDTRFVGRPPERGDQLSPAGLITAARSDGPVAHTLWRLSAAMLPTSVHIRFAQSRPRRRHQQLVTDIDSALPLLRSGANVVLWGYSQDIPRVASLAADLRARVAHMARRHLPAPLEPGKYSAMHVRRGDYVSESSISERFGPAQTPYFAAAAAHMKGPVIIVSDDSEWCRENLIPIIPNSRIIQTSSMLEDFAILTYADDLCLSNSTFSWWAAFSGAHSNVVAPWPWLDDPAEPDLALDGWRRLEKRTGREAPIHSTD